MTLLIPEYGGLTYQAFLDLQATLPICTRKDDIMYAIRHNIAIVVSSATGSGKSTQVPRMIAGEYLRHSIAVTQPRIISAIQLAGRVSTEMILANQSLEYELGKKVIFRTGKTKNESDGRPHPLSFETDGYRLVRQLSQRDHPDFLIIDEAHEGGMHSEFLMTWAKQYLLKNPGAFKIIVMSATADIDTFTDFFDSIQRDVPVIEVPGRLHPIDHIQVTPEEFLPSIVKKAFLGKNILVFAEGKRNIEDIVEHLKPILPKADIFPLHADLSPEDQQRVLRFAPKSGRPVIVVATNVAEASITIPYINTVVDRGFVKEARDRDGIRNLRIEHASDASLKQRAGRGGRVGPGEAVFAGVTSIDRPDFAPSEVERVMHSKHAIMMATQGIQGLRRSGILLHRPDTDLFSQTKQEITATGSGSYDKNGLLRVTEFGRFALGLPLDLRPARMVYESLESEYARDILLAACIINTRGFIGVESQWRVLLGKEVYTSDLIALVDLARILNTKEPSDKLLALLESFQDKKTFESLVSLGELKLYLSLPVSERPPLYQSINLSKLGIKKKRLEEVFASYEKTLERLEEVFISSPEVLERTKRSHDFERAAVSAYHDRSFVFSEKTRTYDGHSEGMHLSGFRPAEASFIKPRSGEVYVGVPFVTSSSFPGDDTMRELALLTFVTRTSESMVQEYSMPALVHQGSQVQAKRSLEKMLENWKIGDVSITTIPEIARQIGLETLNNPVNIPLIMTWFVWEFNQSFKKWRIQNPDVTLDDSVLLLQEICTGEKYRMSSENIVKSLNNLVFDTQIFSEFTKK